PWRIPFLFGLVVAGALSAMSARGWARGEFFAGWIPTWNLGRFDVAIGWGAAGKAAFMFVGGLFIGFGTRLAGGCTSGHGIFGVSNLELPSLVTTISFMAGGVVTTQVLYRVVFR